MSRKINSQAILKNLPSDQQEDIYSRLTVQSADWPDTSLNAVRQWLRETGIETSNRTLSNFRSWYSAKLELEATSDLMETVEEFVRTQNPGWSAAKVRETCVQFFMAHATAKRDVGQFVTIARLDQQERFGQTRIALDKRKLKLNEQKLALLQRKAEQADRAAKVSTSDLTPAEKEAEYRRIFGLGH